MRRPLYTTKDRKENYTRKKTTRTKDTNVLTFRTCSSSPKHYKRFRSPCEFPWIHCALIKFKNLLPSSNLRVDRITVFSIQACTVKMARYWPRSVFCVFMDREVAEVHKHEKKTRPISSHLDRTCLVNKAFSLRLPGKYFLETRRVIYNGRQK